MEKRRKTFMVSLLLDEWEALSMAAVRDCRDPRKEVQYLIRKNLMSDSPQPNKVEAVSHGA